MKKKLYILGFVFLLFGCYEPNKEHDNKNDTDTLTTKSIDAKELIDSLSADSTTAVSVVDSLTSIDTVELDTIKQLMCECNNKTSKVPNRADLEFDFYKFNVDSLSAWKGEKALEVSSLSLDGFDTIPNDFKIFKNVETLILGYIDWDTVTVGDIFPNLKQIKLWGKFLDVSNNPKWLETVEVIHAQKSQIIGLKSFKQTPNLIEFEVAFSGFDSFPSDFTSLKCLKYFQIAAHFYGTIDLSNITLDKMPCLHFVEFQTWGDGISGIPLGIENVKTVKVPHANLTAEEKATLQQKKKL